MGGFRVFFMGVGGPNFFLEPYAKRIIITNHHTKFEISISKHLEIILLLKMDQNRFFGGV